MKRVVPAGQYTIYQSLWRMRGDTKIYLAVMLLYFLVMDFKGVTIGANKFVLSISLLLSYGYLFMPEKSSGRSLPHAELLTPSTHNFYN